MQSGNSWDAGLSQLSFPVTAEKMLFAASSVISQNRGAGKYRRTERLFYWLFVIPVIREIRRKSERYEAAGNAGGHYSE